MDEMNKKQEELNKVRDEQRRSLEKKDSNSIIEKWADPLKSIEHTSQGSNMFRNGSFGGA